MANEQDRHGDNQFFIGLFLATVICCDELGPSPIKIGEIQLGKTDQGVIEIRCIDGDGYRIATYLTDPEVWK